MMSNWNLFSLLTLLFMVSFVACGPRPAQKLGSGVDRQSSAQDAKHQLVALAKEYEGARYKYGGEGPKSFDCSGFTRFVYSEVGIQLPRRSVDQAQFGKKIAINQAQKGDLIVLKKGRKVQHVGIVVETQDGGLWVTHASTSRGVITEDMASSPYWKSRIRYARRILP